MGSGFDLVVESGMDVLTSKTNATILEATQFCSIHSPPLFSMKFDKDMVFRSGSFTHSLLCKYRLNIFKVLINPKINILEFVKRS